MDIRCGTLMPELVALVLVACFQSEDPRSELVRVALDVIKLPQNEGLFFLPPILANSTLVYRGLVQVAAETIASSARQCARMLLMSLTESRSIMRSNDPHKPGIRFAGFANLHRSLAEAGDYEARLTALALFGVRWPSSVKDWRLLAELIIHCRSRRYEGPQIPSAKRMGRC